MSPSAFCAAAFARETAALRAYGARQATELGLATEADSDQRVQDAQQAVAEACAENDIPTPLATDDVPRVLRLALALMDRGR